MITEEIGDRIKSCLDVILKEAREETRLVKQIFYVMLSMYTNNPINLAINAPSGEGKNYVIKKVGELFHKGDVIFLAGLSEKALYHRHGILVSKNPETGEYESIEERLEEIDEQIQDKDSEAYVAQDNNLKRALRNQIKDLEKEKKDLAKDAMKLIDLSHKTLVLLDTPSRGLFGAIMSLLSHDQWEVEYEYADTSNTGIDTKTNVLRGWPSVIFAQAVDYSNYSRWAEVQRRFIITNPNMDPTKYNAAIDLMADKFGSPDFAYQAKVVSNEEKDSARDIVEEIKGGLLELTSRSLKPGENNVIVPFITPLNKSLARQKASDMTMSYRLFSFLSLLPQINFYSRPYMQVTDPNRNILFIQRIPFAVFEDLNESTYLMEYADGVRPYIYTRGNISATTDFKEKHLWCLKSTGLGVSEFFLRLMAWLCTSTDDYKNTQMCIVTGPNIDLATKLIKRLKAIFSNKLGIYFSNKETVLELNGCMIEAYPSNHLDSFRSLTNPKFIFLDEADMFRKGEQEQVRDTSERYIGKSDPYIVMVSTPAGPGSLFYKIEAEPEDTCIYRRLKLDYTYGLNKIYTEEEIERAKHSPSFDREYRCQFSGFIGNLFSPLQVNRVVQLGQLYKDLPTNDYTLHSVGVDFGFSSSATAIVLTEFLKQEKKVRVLYAEEFEHANPQDIVDICFNLYRKHWNTWFFVDGANTGAVSLMKVAFNESLNWQNSKTAISPESMKILPINFGTTHKEMLSHLALLVSKSYLAVPKQFDKLIISLRTAWANELSLDKEKTSYSDSLDALRLACKMYKMN